MLGRLSRARVMELYQRIDVVVAPSRMDSMPIAVIEGMMNRKVCIVSDTTGISRYINNRINGFVFKNGDIHELAKSMEWAIQNPDKWSNIVNEARKIYESYFTLDKLESNIKDVEKEVFKKPLMMEKTDNDYEVS